MKTFPCLIALLPVVCLAQSFTDITLDNPDLSGITPFNNAGVYQGLTSQLLPGWTLTINGSPAPQIYYTPLGVGYSGPYVTLTQNPSSVDPVDNSPYLLRLATFVPPPPFNGPGVDIRMSQIGQIPADAAGLQIGANAGVQLYINGSYLGAVDIERNAIPIFDVSQYAGKTVNLEFRFPINAMFTFDVLGFRSVPEPSTSALVGLGAGIIGWQAWRRRKI